MTMQVKAFNAAGIERFRDYICDLRLGISHEEVPLHYLEDASLLEAVDGYAEVERVDLPTRKYAAEYLNETLSPLPHSEYDNIGMWAWLTLFFFDQVCPPNAKGIRKPGMDYRYVPTSTTSWKDYHRHTLAGPFRLFRLHGEFANVFLSNPLHKVGDINEQLASRSEIISNPALIHAVHEMYYDDERQSYKRGCTTQKKAGTYHRLIKVKRQLDMTYDFFSMTYKEILSILPAEFNSWWMDAESA